MKPLRISHYTVTSALGLGRAAHAAALSAERTGLAPQAFDGCTLATFTGTAPDVDAVKLRAGDEAWDCRNNRLALLGLQQDGFLDVARDACARYGSGRVGVFMGTSTSGLHETELAYRDRSVDGALPAWYDYVHTHSPCSSAHFVQQVVGARGPAHVTSTACSSSAKVFASAHRAMRAGLCDAAIVGGVDSLCLLTLYGFNALQLVSPEPCRPADAKRNGISIGEAAGYALVEWPESAARGALVLGYGESSDAHHMSAPEPEGRGAHAAMAAALERAGLAPSDIDYINLHGTATRANDASEDKAVMALFGAATPCSSTKGWTGHTLGAAGIVEAALSLLAIDQGVAPRSLNTIEKDPALQANVLLQARPQRMHRVLSNSFGFGGSNCSLVLGAES
ncbi:MAG TPA: beta-ketoacyl-[acyl-carrier-protein] synthase family protein [Verrucomicrobiae bacterium]|nr:beta-ketoacyl-[acyl-carrier-protein] synthase family protein [Verrucomicrobiae bacterium]